MTTLTIEQFEKYQTPYAKGYHTRPSVKFNSAQKSIKLLNEDIILKRNEAQIRPQELTRFQPSLGTMIGNGKSMLPNSSEIVKIYSTQGTAFLDFWLGETKLSDYGTLVDDYDVAEIEEIHIQAASKYGW